MAGRCDPPPAGARVYEVRVREEIEHTIYIEALDGEAATDAYDEASGHIEDVFQVAAHHVIDHGADVVGFTEAPDKFPSKGG